MQEINISLFLKKINRRNKDTVFIINKCIENSI